MSETVVHGRGFESGLDQTNQILYVPEFEWCCLTPQKFPCVTIRQVLILDSLCVLTAICLFPVMIQCWARNADQQLTKYFEPLQHQRAGIRIQLNQLKPQVSFTDRSKLVILLQFLSVTCSYVRVYMFSSDMMTLITAAYSALPCLLLGHSVFTQWFSFARYCSDVVLLPRDLQVTQYVVSFKSSYFTSLKVFSVICFYPEMIYCQIRNLYADRTAN